MMHIDLFKDEDCTGCGACSAGCPRGCISMEPNQEGFLYPKINAEECVECGECVAVCPMLHSPVVTSRMSSAKVHAAWHLNDEIRLMSSSGGVFMSLAEMTVLAGGVVVAAAYGSDFCLRHIAVENQNDLFSLCGSKYVQSSISNKLFSDIRGFLDADRKVLFVGTPCQVAGLRNYLDKDYTTLCCCDLVCHGIPSPEWFKSYINNHHKQGRFLTHISFRDKTRGWKNYCVKKEWDDGCRYESAASDPYIVAFIKNCSLRESCYCCPFAKSERVGDITLGDYWGVATKYPEYDLDDRGTSLVIINTITGRDYFEQCRENLFVGTGDLNHAKKGNQALIHPVVRPRSRDHFYYDMLHLSFQKLRKKYKLKAPSFGMRTHNFVRRFFYKRGAQEE